MALELIYFSVFVYLEIERYLRHEKGSLLNSSMVLNYFARAFQAMTLLEFGLGNSGDAETMKLTSDAEVSVLSCHAIVYSCYCMKYGLAPCNENAIARCRKIVSLNKAMSRRCCCFPCRQTIIFV